MKQDEITILNIDDFIREKRSPHFYWKEDQWKALKQFMINNGSPFPEGSSEVVYLARHHHKL